MAEGVKDIVGIERKAARDTNGELAKLELRVDPTTLLVIESRELLLE